MKPATTILLTLALGAATLASAPASADMYRCVDSEGRPVFADRKLGTDCRAITIEPYPVDEHPETYYGLVVTAETETINLGY